MNVLVLCDDTWHPGEVIVRGMRPLQKQGFNFDFVMACKDILTVKMLEDYDVIVNARGDCHSPGNHTAVWFEDGVTAVMPDDFKAYVEEGHGFIALHAGNTYTRERRKDMAEFIGNDFITHPPQCTITANPAGDHPIMKGIGSFTFRDEHYMIDVHAEDADVFMTSTSETKAGTQVAGYTREIGKGRLVVLTPCHNCAVLESDEYAQILTNAINWAAGKL